MKVQIIYIIIAVLLAISFGSYAQKRPALPEQPLDYRSRFDGLDLSAFPYNIQEDIEAVTNEGATLGRVLFYDKHLSVNNEVACASCHRQELAFTDGQQFSTGYAGERTHRNSMAAFNTVFDDVGFFWDMRIPTLEEQVLLPIQDSVEMGMNLDSLVNKLAMLDYYPELFEACFGTDEITVERIADALAQFLRTIISDRSKFDEGVGIGFANFTEQEEHGRQLFSHFAVPGSGERGTNCFLCHSTIHLGAGAQSEGRLTQSASIGIDEFTLDPGIGGITGDERQLGTFKITTLRNIELTGPYMHDGRFETLERVVDHYDLHVLNHTNLDQIIRAGGNIRPMRLDLTIEEKEALVAFLKTLTDYELLVDERYSDPFEDPENITGDKLIPSDFLLYQNYPNPFNPSTTIRFQLPAASQVVLNVHDVRGRLVRELLNERVHAGLHTVTWDGADHNGQVAASGVYFYRLVRTSSGPPTPPGPSSKGGVRGDGQTRKMLLIR